MANPVFQLLPFVTFWWAPNGGHVFTLEKVTNKTPKKVTGKNLFREIPQKYPIHVYTLIPPKLVPLNDPCIYGWYFVHPPPKKTGCLNLTLDVSPAATVKRQVVGLALWSSRWSARGTTFEVLGARAESHRRGGGDACGWLEKNHMGFTHTHPFLLKVRGWYYIYICWKNNHQIHM